MTRFKPQATILSLALLAPLAASLAVPAQAQSRAVATPRIVSMAVHAEEALLPGSTLQFTVQGTPNARNAQITLANGINVPLRQISTGNYRGHYTVQRNDRLDPRGVVQVKMTHGSRVTTRTFSYPASFQAVMMGAGPAPRVAIVEPEIERFVLRHEGEFDPGREVHFRVRGAPGADVTLDLPGLASDLPMREVRPGVYEGSYTLRRRDDPDGLFDAVAHMRSGDRHVAARLDRDVVRRDGDWRDERRASR